MYETTEKYELRLIGRAQPLNAQVAVNVRDWTEAGQRNRVCTITIDSAEQSWRASEFSVYHAFQDVREQLERAGLTPDCYGSCPDVQTSGMLCDMGDGTMAYRMSTGAAGAAPVTVNIFDREPGLTLGSVAEQTSYYYGREDGSSFVPQRSLLYRMLKHPTAFMPLAMSGAALATIGVFIAMHGTAPQADEGAAAHIWQLLMAGQAPLILYFAIKWVPQSPKQAVPILALQVGAAIAAMAPVFVLNW